MRLRLSPATIAQVLRNRQYTPGRDMLLTYPVELDPTDYPLGTTMVAAALVIMLDYGLNPLLVYQINPTLNAAGQITDTGAAGAGSLQFILPAADLLGYRDLGPLACEVVVTDSRGYQGSLEKFALVPMVSTAGKPVDHVTVAPAAFALAYPNTQPLTVTAYDVDGNVLTGRTVVWSSSDPGTATVDANGVVSVEQAGSATISATVEGKSASAVATTTTPAALVLKLDQNLANPIERTQPFIVTPSGHTDGFSDTVPIPAGSTIFNNVRVSYPRSRTEWAEATLSEIVGDAANEPQRYVANFVDGGAGPVDGSKTFDITFLPDFVSVCFAGYNVTTTQPSNDNQDVTDFKRGAFLGVKARDAGDIGKEVYIELGDIVTNFPGPPIAYSPLLLVTLTAEWQYPGIDIDSYAHLTNLAIVVRPAWDQAQMATGVKLLANSLGVTRLPPTPEERPRLNAFDEELGLHSQYQHQNCWAENNVTLGGGATRVLSAADSPRAANYLSGKKRWTVTLPVGGYLATTNPVTLGQLSTAPPTQPPKAAWFHIEAPGLANGKLRGVISAVGGPTWGPVITDAKDYWNFHRVRQSFAVGGGTASIVDNGDGTLTVTTQTAHGLTNGQLIDLNGRLNGFPHVPYNNLSVSAVTATTFKVSSAAVDRLLDNGAEVIPRYTSFTWRIENATGAPLIFDYDDLGLTCEEDRNQGRHNAMIPKRALTGPAYSDSAFTIIRNDAALITRAEGIFHLRFTPRHSAEQICSWLGDSPELFQRGPGGSNQFNLSAGVRVSPTRPGMSSLYIDESRGAGFNGYAGFGAEVGIPTGAMPAFVEVDFAFAWKAGAIVYLGLGFGAGSAMMQRIVNGLVYGGFAATISSSAGTAWSLTDGGSIASLARRIALLGDRDYTRQFPGSWRRIGMGDTVPNIATIGDEIEYNIFRRCGARRDLRVAA